MKITVSKTKVEVAWLWPIFFRAFNVWFDGFVGKLILKLTMALVSEFCCILGMGIAFWGWGRSRIRMDSNAGRLMGFSLIFRQFEVRSLESATAAILMMVKESFTIIMTSFHHFTIIAVAHLLLSSSSQLSHFPPENKWFFFENWWFWFKEDLRCDCTTYTCKLGLDIESVC